MPNGLCYSRKPELIFLLQLLILDKNDMVVINSLIVGEFDGEC